MKNYNVTFKEIKNHDLELIYQWFQIPHILTWYARGKRYAYAEVQEKYQPRINDSTIQSYIIYDRNKPVGYIQAYQVKHHLPDSIKNNNHPIFDTFTPEELAGMDVFIADQSYLHTGFSGIAVGAFIEKYIRNNFRAVLVDPMQHNAIAVIFFKKNKFIQIASQDDRYYLMIRIMADEDEMYSISYDPAPKYEESKLIWQGISDHANKVRGLLPGKPFAYYIRNKLSKIKGGCTGYIYYGCLYVDLLWVDETLRGKGFGTRLMRDAERLAQNNHCNFISVNTMDFEALAFYLKLGYVVEFERKGFEKNSKMYFLRKDLYLA